MNHYKIQVLLSIYNGERYLDEQLGSLMTQEDVDIHVLIRDDGSCDMSVNIINEYIKRYPNNITFYTGMNVGAKQSFFNLIVKSSEDFNYFCFCDQDDVWDSRKIINAINLIRENDLTQPILYCSSTKMVNSQLKFINSWPNRPDRELTVYNAVLENIAVGCTIVMNANLMVLVKNNLPKNYGNVIMHDWWIYLCASCFGKVIFDPRPFILYRQHNDNLLGGQTETFAIKWKKRYTRFVRNYYGKMLSTQAEEFFNIYMDQLPNKEKTDLRTFIVKRDLNFFKRISYVLKTPMYKQRRLDSFFYRIKFVLRKL
ncbi:glycosyltransferase [Paenibacillus sp. G2S3]|uniref:glycosyltransferase n=1 Tax=Paenibacillus sp. G2S3 TaxID=3047872 RepID=UPI0024C1AE9D|nr:glycosyltransferase [Paenibacillus sp. G2S3]WHY19019.1 glycosyltransferase [Paenibacillus sp. G2S3]